MTVAHERSQEGTAEPVSDRRTRPRLQLLDVARLVAALEVMWLHTPESAVLERWVSLGGPSVPFFTFSMVFFAVEAGRVNIGRGFPNYALTRCLRLLAPFLLWTLIYLAIRNLKVLLVTHQALVLPTAGMLLAGSTHHLWFLTFAFPVVLLAFAAGRASAQSGVLHRFAMGVTSVLVGALAMSVPKVIPSVFDPQMQYFTNQVYLNAPSAFWAIAIALWYPLIPQRVWHSLWTAVAAGALAVSASILIVLATPHRLLVDFGGLSLFLLGLVRLGGARLNRLADLGKLSFGVYLVHVIFVEGMQAITGKLFGMSQTAARDLAILSTSFVLSIVLTRGLGRVRWGRFLLGE